VELTQLPLPDRLDVAAIDELLLHLDAAQGAVALRGAVPGAFCTGMELGEKLPSPDDARRALARFAQLLDMLQEREGPVLALVDGPALGGGLGLAAAADLVLCSERAVFGLPEVMLGLVPGLVLPVVARRTGAVRARLLALGEPPLTAQAALACGLADQVCADLDESLRVRMRRLSRMDPEALRVAKSLSRKVGSPEYRDQAINRFCEQLAKPSTHTRIARQLAGDPPWGDE
jgi:enoyl-CoA hydratase/carnithine racemase